MKQTWQVSSEQPANHDPCPPALALPRRCTSRSSTPPATAPSAATLRPWRNTSASPGFSVWAMSLLCAVQVMLLFFISLFIRWLHCHFTVIDYTATIPSLIPLPLCHYWLHCHFTVVDCTAALVGLRQEKRPLNSIGVFNFKSPTGCPQCAWDFWRTSSCQHSPQSSLTLLVVVVVEGGGGVAPC